MVTVTDVGETDTPPTSMLSTPTPVRSPALTAIGPRLSVLKPSIVTVRL